MNAEKQLELKKHVNTIHCSNNLTLVQRKLFNALLYNAYADLPYKSSFNIRARNLCELIGYNSNDVAKLKKALLGLITTALEWNVVDSLTGKEGKWKASAILAAAEMSEGLCTYEYSQVLKEFLYQPEIYGRINIALVAKFKSTYGLALYENCIRYQGLQQTPWFPINVFRTLMGVVDDKYAAFNDFKKRVINIAVEEVNAISPVKVTPEFGRINQKVVKIRFKLEKQQNLALIGEVEDKELEGILRDIFSMSQDSIKSVLLDYERNYLKEKIDIILSSESFAAGQIRGLAGYLIDALKKDYKPSKSSKVVVTEKRKAQELAEKERLAKQEEYQSRYEKYMASKIDSYVTSLSKEEYEKLLLLFNESMKSTSQSYLLKCYSRDGYEHPYVKAELKLFIKQQREKEIGEILSYEEFQKLLKEYS